MLKGFTQSFVWSSVKAAIGSHGSYMVAGESSLLGFLINAAT